MGYYSDVHCIVYGAPEQMLRFTTAQLLIKGSALDTWKNHLKEYEVGYDRDDYQYTVIELKLERIKWYDDFHTVTAWMQMLWQIDEANDSEDDQMKGMQYEFVRVGDEHHDVETHYSTSTEGWLVVRTITETDLPQIKNQRNITDGCIDEPSEG